MRVALTGTPGTGKTTVSEAVGEQLGLDVVHLSALVDAEPEALAAGYDDERDTREVDLDALRERLAGRDDVLLEGHLAHHLPVDRCVVLRCRPDVIEHRLLDRGYEAAKARENAESEALDVVLAEAVERCDAVVEIDATELAPDDAAAAVAEAVREEREGWGDVAWTEYLEDAAADDAGADTGADAEDDTKANAEGDDGGDAADDTGEGAP